MLTEGINNTYRLYSVWGFWIDSRFYWMFLEFDDKQLQNKLKGWPPIKKGCLLPGIVRLRSITPSLPPNSGNLFFFFGRHPKSDSDQEFTVETFAGGWFGATVLKWSFDALTVISSLQECHRRVTIILWGNSIISKEGGGDLEQQFWGGSRLVALRHSGTVLWRLAL